MSRPFVYDAGALIAAERNDRFTWGIHAKGTTEGRRLVLPTPVLAQVWRDGARLARLARFVSTCEVLDLDDRIAKAAGVLLGRAATSDVVDAVVATVALDLHGIAITSDPEDLTRLCNAAEVRVPQLIRV